MKRILTIILSLWATVAISQPIVSTGTYYVIPPTNGCDGVWAAGPIPFGQCTPTYQYLIEPFGCSDGFIGTIGDTLFISLCSVPCEMSMVDANGGQCFICDLDFDLTIDVKEDSEQGIDVFPNPVSTTLNIRSERAEPIALKLFDSAGRLVLNEWLQSTQTSLDVSHLNPGMYYLSLESGEELRMQTIEVMDR